MTALGNFSYNADSGGSTAFNGHVRFNTSSSATGTVLDFAWNNPDTTFLNAEVRVTAGTDNSTAHRRFHFNGTSQQLQNAFTTWTTDTLATGRLTFGGGMFSRLGKIRHALMQIFEEPSKEIKKERTKKDKILLKAKRKSEKPELKTMKSSAHIPLLKDQFAIKFYL